jgi:hypothetical protein
MAVGQVHSKFLSIRVSGSTLAGMQWPVMPMRLRTRGEWIAASQLSVRNICFESLLASQSIACLCALRCSMWTNQSPNTTQQASRTRVGGQVTDNLVQHFGGD